MNPKKPTKISMRPSIVIGRLCGRMSFADPSALNLPMRGPRWMSTPSVNAPATRCTQPAAPTSRIPNSVASQPAGCQPQAAAMIHTTDPRIVVRMRNALRRTRSMSAPERIEPVVAANRANAPQNTPLAESPRFGPMFALHGSAAFASSSMRGTPVGIEL